MATAENSPFRSLVLSIPATRPIRPSVLSSGSNLGVNSCMFGTIVSSAGVRRHPALGQRAGIPSDSLLFQMGKDLFNYLRIFDTCDDLDGATACVTGRYIDIA